MRHLALLGAVLVACSPDPGDREGPAAGPPASSTSQAQASPAAAARPAGILGRYDFETPERIFDLPGRLDEISGLALTTDGRLIAHDDERGRVHVIDPVTGEVGKNFDLGSGTLMDDFEGIATIGERLFLVSSRGFLYEFREGADDQDVVYRVTDTGVGGRCEIEGLDYDPVDDALLVACKRSSPDRGYVVIHRLAVDPQAAGLEPIRVVRAGLAPFDVDTDFQASAVLATPAGTLLLLSAPTESIIEVARDGTVLGGRELSPDRHPQPEGLALGPDGTLYIADEENDEDARVTVYFPRTDEAPGAPRDPEVGEGAGP